MMKILCLGISNSDFICIHNFIVNCLTNNCVKIYSDKHRNISNIKIKKSPNIELIYQIEPNFAELNPNIVIASYLNTHILNTVNNLCYYICLKGNVELIDNKILNKNIKLIMLNNCDNINRILLNMFDINEEKGTPLNKTNLLTNEPIPEKTINAFVRPFCKQPFCKQPFEQKYNSTSFIHENNIVFTRQCGTLQYTAKPTTTIENLKNLILILDFPNWGGGTTFFINSAVSRYKCYQSFVIIRPFNNFININLNDDYDVENVNNESELLNFIKLNKSNFSKIFVNHTIGYSNTFLTTIFQLNLKVITITHDFSLIFTKPQFSFDDIIKKRYVLNNTDINLYDNVITQYKGNLHIFDNYIKWDKIQIEPLPDYSNKLKKINTNNTKFVIGIIGMISLLKGCKMFEMLFNYYKIHDKNITFVVFGDINVNCIKNTYKNVSELNELLIKYKPNALLELSTWAETYSYALTLGMITDLPILYLKKPYNCTVVERLKTYNKSYEFNNINTFNKTIYTLKQDYFYTIEPCVYFSNFWDKMFNNQLNNVVNDNVVNDNVVNDNVVNDNVVNDNDNNNHNLIQFVYNNVDYNNVDYNIINNVICVIHVTNMNNGIQIFKDQFNYILSSKLINRLDYVFVTLLGNYVDVEIHHKIKLVYHSNNMLEWEFPAIRFIKCLSDYISTNCKILYIHTKGVLQKRCSYEWRKYLEYFLIEHHELCLNALNTYNCVGVNQYFYFNKINRKRNHFSGNFWWSNSNHIKKLPMINIGDDRYATEHYLIGDFAKHDYRYTYSMHHSHHDLYSKPIHPSEYNIELIKTNVITQLNTEYVKHIPIYGIYFVCCIGNYYSTVEEQLTMLVDNGLYKQTDKILCFICNYDEKILQILNKYDKIQVISTSDNLYEKFAINNYKKYVDGEYCLYYFHTKSVSRKQKCFSDWRKTCDYFTLNKWRLSIELLKYYDCVGINMKQFPKMHYSGNYWWSRSSHLNKLVDVGDKYLSPEMYIMSYCKTNKICIYNSNINHGDTAHDDYLYNNITDETLINNMFAIPTFNIGDKECINMCDVNLMNEPPIFV